jgi:hypothetical protein
MTHKSFEELQRRVELTSKARYEASRRLSYHAIFSQWTLAMLAIGQITITLISVFKFNTHFSTSYINFMEIFFGVLVLTYSLLLGMGNHSLRSVYLHKCGLDLSEIARKLNRINNDSSKKSKKEYDEYAHNYLLALEKCENHSNIDYLFAQNDYNNKKNEKTYSSCLHYFIDKFCLLLRYSLEFFHYFASIALIIVWIICLIF